MDLATLSIRVETLELKQANREMDAAADKSRKLENSLKGLAAVLGAGLIAKQFLDVNVEFQRLQASLVTVTGSADKAAVAFEKLKQFAQETPFQLTEVTNAFISLKNRGLDATQETLRKYGDAASALGLNLMDAVMVVNSAIAGETESIKRWGFTMVNEKDKVTLGFGDMKRTLKKDALEIQKAILEMTSERFAGGMQRQMATLGGQISNLKDAWEVFLAKLGGVGPTGAAGGALTYLTDMLTMAKDKIDDLASDASWWEFVDSFATLGRQITGLVGQLGEMAGAIGEAGVKSSFFARIWQGISLLVAGVRDTITLMRNLWGQFFVWFTSKLADWVESFQQVIMAIPRKLRESVGMGDTEAAQLSTFLIKLRAGSMAMDKMVQEMIMDSGSAFDEVMDDISTTQVTAMKRAKEYADEIRRLKKLAEESQDPGAPGRKMGTGDGGYLAYLESQRKLMLELLDIQERRAKAKDAFEANQAALEQEAAAYETAMDTIYPYRQEVLKLMEAEKALNISFREGDISRGQMEEGIRNLQKQMPILTKNFGDLRQTFDDWARSSTDALVELSFTGKAAFSDLITSMLKDLARLALYKNVTGPLFDAVAKMIRNGFTSGGGGMAYTPYGDYKLGTFGSSPAPAVVGGGGSMNTSIVVNVTSEGNVSTQASGRAAVDLGKQLEPIMNAWAIKHRRPGGMLAST